MPGPKNLRTGMSATAEPGVERPLRADRVDAGEKLRVSDVAEYLADVLEEYFSDPAASLVLITDEAGRIIATRKASTGGAMTTQPTAPSKASRPAGTDKPIRSYEGFERESATYGRLKPELLARCEGKFVVLVGEEMIGPFESFKDARWEGYERFGFGPLYVKQVLAEEPIVHTSRCP